MLCFIRRALGSEVSVNDGITILPVGILSDSNLDEDLVLLLADGEKQRGKDYFTARDFTYLRALVEPMSKLEVMQVNC